MAIQTRKWFLSFMLLTSFVLSTLLFCSCSVSQAKTHIANHDKPLPSWLSNYQNQSEFEISNPSQLEEFSNFVNGVYTEQGDFKDKKISLSEDITFNENCQAGIGGMANAEEFWSIGNTSCTGDEWFAGEFDGKGHKISGLYSTEPSCYGNVGFFAGLNESAYIHNIEFSNTFFQCYEDDNPVAIIASVSKTAKSVKIENIYVSDDVFCIGRNDAGGILGVSSADSADIEICNCAFMGTAQSIYRSTEFDKNKKVTFCSNTGGIIANSKNSSLAIKDCLSAGTITGGTNSSGIVGNADGPTTITNCIDISELNSSSKKYGYRLFGGTSTQSSNDKLNINNNICLITDTKGEILNFPGISNNKEISSIKDVVDIDRNLIEMLPNWTNRSYGETCSDIPIPKTISDFAPNSKYTEDNIAADDNVHVNYNIDESMFFTFKYKKNYIDELIKNKGSNNIVVGSITTPLKNLDSVSEFTIEELDKLSPSNKIYASTEEEVNTNNIDESNRYYVFQNYLKEIERSNYETQYAAIPYIKINDETVYAKDYIHASLSETAWKEICDVKSTSSGNYRYKITDEYFTDEYSPYSSDFRSKLLSYVINKPIDKIESPDAKPEEVGLSSQEIYNLFQDMKSNNLATHTTMIMRHGKIVVEKYADGYNADTLQRMYSISKSITGMSLGLLLNDKDYDVNINDPVGKYFPEYSNCDPVILNTTIKQCLTMSTPFTHGVYEVGDKDNKNWVEKFFTAPKDKDPNANTFWYDTCGTHLIGTIIERVTGKDFLTYAKEKAFSKLGLSDSSWCVKSPEGVEWGGSGVMITTRDLLNIGKTIMSGGAFNGEQLMDENFVKDSVTSWIDDSSEGYSCQDGRGYGYYIWLTDIGFAFEGMGNQLCVCMPDKDIVFCCTSDNQGYSNGYHDLFDVINRHLYQNSYDSSLPKNDEAWNRLNNFKLQLPVQAGEKTSSMSSKFSTKSFSGGDSDTISNFSIDFDKGELNYTCHGEENKIIKFGYDSNVFGSLNETSYSWKTINVPMTDNGRNDGYRMACSGAWTDEDTFVIYVQIIDDYLANMKMTFKFDSDSGKCMLTNKYTAEGFLGEYKMKNVDFYLD